MPDSPPDKISKRTLEYVSLVEGHRTKRLQTIVGGVTVCVIAAAVCLFKALDRPWWQTLIIGLAAAAFPNVFPVAIIVKTFRRYVRRKNVRIKTLEGKFDSKRTSSGLKEDGTP